MFYLSSSSVLYRMVPLQRFFRVGSLTYFPSIPCVFHCDPLPVLVRVRTNVFDIPRADSGPMYGVGTHYRVHLCLSASTISLLRHSQINLEVSYAFGCALIAV